MLRLMWPAAAVAGAAFWTLFAAASGALAQGAAADNPAPAPPAYCLAVTPGAGASAADVMAVLSRRFAGSGLAADVRLGADGLRVSGAVADDLARARRLVSEPGDFAIYRIDDGQPPPAYGQDLPGTAILTAATDPPAPERVFVPPDFTAADLGNVEGGYDPAGNVAVLDLTFTELAAARLSVVTAGMVGQRLAVAWDGIIIAAPVIVEPVSGGIARITGAFTIGEAEEMAAVLAAGPLPSPLELIAELPVADCIESAPPGAAPPN